jgi:hypothetical protein
MNASDMPQVTRKMQPFQEEADRIALNLAADCSATILRGDFPTTLPDETTAPYTAVLEILWEKDTETADAAATRELSDSMRAELEQVGSQLLKRLSAN